MMANQVVKKKKKKWSARSRHTMSICIRTAKFVSFFSDNNNHIVMNIQDELQSVHEYALQVLHPTCI